MEDAERHLQPRETMSVYLVTSSASDSDMPVTCDISKNAVMLLSQTSFNIQQHFLCLGSTTEINDCVELIRIDTYMNQHLS